MADTSGKRPEGRNLSDFTDANGNGLQHAERWLLHCARTGKAYWAGRKRPEKSTNRNTIRPGFLRFLALGGDDHAPVHENGIQLIGAYIDGALDLNHCNVPAPLLLKNCRISGPLHAEYATARLIDLLGTLVDGLDGDGLTTHGDLLLHNQFHATGEVRLLGAHIGGELNCENGTIENPLHHALNADHIKTTGSVFLDDGFHAIGEVRLLGANVGGNLVCRNGAFQNPEHDALSGHRMKTGRNVFLDKQFTAWGAVHLQSAEIAGDLWLGHPKNNEGKLLYNSRAKMRHTGCDDALDLAHSKIHGAFYFAPRQIVGSIDFRFAYVSVLRDDCESLPPLICTALDGAKLRCRVALDGFIYDRIGSWSSTNARARRRWLERQPEEDLTTDFKPQPYEQLASVLRTMGHTRDAKDILIAKRQQEFRNDAHRLHGFLRWLHPHITLHPLLQFLSGHEKRRKQFQSFLEVFKGNVRRFRKDTSVALFFQKSIRTFRWIFHSLIVSIKKGWTHVNSASINVRAMNNGDSLRRNITSYQIHRSITVILYLIICWTIRALTLTLYIPRMFFRFVFALLTNLLNLLWAWLKYLAVEGLIAHGYRVYRALLWALGLWILSSFIFYQAADQGVMVPSDPRVFLAEDLKGTCAGGNWTAEITGWRVEPGTGKKAPYPADACDAPRIHTEHTTLQPAIYALDVILPFAPLGQESAWKPSVSENFELSVVGWRFDVWDWGAVALMWFDIVFGWIVGLLIAAVVSGVVKRE